MTALTPCIKAILDNTGSFVNPILQLTEEPKVIAGTAQQKQNMERYKVTISDGINMTSALLFHNVTSSAYQVSALQPNQIVRITRFTTTKSQGRSLMIIHDIEPLGVSDRIGNPTKISYRSESSASAAQQQQPAPPVKPLPPKVVQSPIKLGGSKNQNASHTNPQQQAAPPQHMGNGEQDLSRLPIFPIRSLNNYNNRWCIKARVTSKSDIKTYNNKNGGGTLFSCELIDESGTEIRATAFSETCDKLYPQLSVGNVYLISKGTIRLGNKRYTSIKHDYEIMFSAATIVQPCEDDGKIPKNHFEFVSIDQIKDLPKDTTLDVIGIITNVSPLQSVTSKANNNTFEKRTLTILDTSSYSIEVTFWGEKAVKEIPLNVVVAIRGCRVSDFNGKSLGTVQSSVIEYAPDLPEASRLTSWYESQSGNVTVYPLSSSSGLGGGGGGSGSGGAHSTVLYTIGAAREAQMGLSDDADYFGVNALVSIIKHDRYSYLACLGCKGKVEPGYDGKYTCPKCHSTNDSCAERYVFNFVANDFTGSMWLSGFDEAGKVIMGKEASEITALKSAGDGDRLFDEAFMDATHRWFTFNVRGRLEVYNEEKRPKYSVMSVKRLDFVEESKHLLQIINSYN